MLCLASLKAAWVRFQSDQWFKIKVGSAALLFVSVLSFFSLFGHTSLSSPKDDLFLIDVHEAPSLPPTQPILKPRVSVIAIWKGREKPYLNNFFTSYRANSDVVELLFINIRGDEEDECVDFTKWTGPPGPQNNIKVVCLSLTEYWALHRNYFCARWKCNKGQADRVFREMVARAPADSYHSHFRLWRGYVFKHLLSPGIEWWGWTDPDTFVGNFKSQFPWDATEYDIVVPVGGDIGLLYMRGHLCFFRAGRETEEKLNQYHHVSNMVLYFNHHRPHYAAEESEFSAFIFRDPRITFLVVPQLLVDIPIHLTTPNTAKFGNIYGVYSIQWPWQELPTSFPNYPMLSMPTSLSSFAPTFSANGTTYPIELFAGNWSGGIWFPKEFTTYYDVDWNLGPPGCRRFVGRGGKHAGGSQGVWTRIEPQREAIAVSGQTDSSVEVKLAEGLYIHWFEEKHNGPWFVNLPDSPLQSSQTLVTFAQFGAEIWDHEMGQTIWRGLGKDPEEKTKRHNRRKTHPRLGRNEPWDSLH